MLRSLSTAFVFALTVSYTSLAVAQSKSPVRSAGAVTTGANDQFIMRQGTVVLRQGSTTKPLTQNVRLADGTKVNYKSGIVEFPTGKITTLQEGDYVTMKGNIVFATPASAAAARNDSTAKVTPDFDRYIDRGTSPSYEQLSTRNILLTRKVRILSDKITLLNKPDTPQRTADLQQLDQQLQALDNQLR